MPGLNPGITVFEPSPSNIVGVHGLEREHPARSKMLTYAGAVTSGVLAALALQIYLSGAGFDWLLIDTEHSPIEVPMVLDQLRAMEGSGTTPIVRPACTIS